MAKWKFTIAIQMPRNGFECWNFRNATTEYYFFAIHRKSMCFFFRSPFFWRILTAFSLAICFFLRSHTQYMIAIMLANMFGIIFENTHTHSHMQSKMYHHFFCFVQTFCHCTMTWTLPKCNKFHSHFNWNQLCWWFCQF